MWTEIRNAREETERALATWSDAQEVCLLPSTHTPQGATEGLGWALWACPFTLGHQRAVSQCCYLGEVWFSFSPPRPVLSNEHQRTWLVLIAPNALAHKKLLAWCEAVALEWRDNRLFPNSPSPNTPRAAGSLARLGVSLCPFSERPWESSTSKRTPVTRSRVSIQCSLQHSPGLPCFGLMPQLHSQPQEARGIPRPSTEPGPERAPMCSANDPG